ncbi:hypothetical protein J4481_02220 [Candidatus Pacearchaeota archaeon]|nr:hypothetical protein [Candidatus Pacearchaeota archaeon]
MDKIKEAFQLIKDDIFSLQNELNYIKESIQTNNQNIKEIVEILSKLHEKTERLEKEKSLDTQTDQQTDRHINSTVQTHPSTHNLPLEDLKPINLVVSKGNRGVSTDRQTDRQTDQHTQNKPEIGKNTLDNAVEILSSLDDLKKEVRLKFKRLTEQEILVFSTIYQFDEEVGYSDYKSLSQRLNLTESSIRDYVGRLIKKGIPIEKNKINNKQIQLNISANLKKIATLNTILQLRDL